MKRILHLITSLHGGGTENFLAQVVRFSPSRWEHRVRFLKEDGVTGERLCALGVEPKRATALSLWQELRRDPPDVLHTLLFRAHQIGRVVGKVAGVPLIVSSQRAIDGWTQPWHNALDAYSLRRCDLVLVNSEAARAVVEKRRGPRATPAVERLWNGVDPAVFTRRDAAEARRTLGLPEKAIIGGTLTRLHLEKGADRIPRWAESLLTDWPELHLVVAGVGPLEAPLREVTRDKPWSPRLHWLKWVPDTPLYLSALDFFWLLSREESFPQALLEASAMGVPWVATEVGGVRELLTEGVVGRTGRSMDELVAMAPVFQRISPDLQKDARQAAERIRSRFSVQAMADSFFKTLESRL